MFLGVPYVPFFLGAGSCLLLAMYVSMTLLIFGPFIVVAMQQMAKRDEMIFRLLGLHIQTRMGVSNVALHEGLWVVSPLGGRVTP